MAVEWKGMELHPELPEHGLPSEEFLSGDYFRRAKENLRRLAAEDSLAMINPTLIVNSHLALETAEFARERGAFAALHRRLFEAYFQEDLNIGDRETLVKLAGEAGLDGDEVQNVLAERRYQRQLSEVLGEARRLGITGAPTFLICNQRVVGAQPYEVLRQAAIMAGAKPREPQGATNQ